MKSKGSNVYVQHVEMFQQPVRINHDACTREYDIPWTTRLTEMEAEDICPAGSQVLFEIFTIFVNNALLRAVVT